MWKFAASLGLSLALATTAHAVPIQMENTDVRDFARWYADHRNIDITFAPGVEGTLTVYAEDVPNADLDTFVDGVLEANGFEILPGNPPILAPLQDRPDDFTREIDVPQADQATTVLELHNVRADDVAPIVTHYLARTTSGSTAPARAQVIHAANALLVNGPAERLADLERLLPRFDVRHPQVLIQAVIFETNAGDSLDLGVSLGSTTSRPVAGGFNTRNLSDGLALPGGAFGIFDGNTLALAVNAIQRNSSARVLSTPRLLALSGQAGRISVGQNVPIITGRVTGEAADIENPFQTIERKDVGVTLAVTPVVTASGLIVMDVETTADSLTDSLEASDIITNQRRIDTTVQIETGQTVLLGGLVSEETSEKVSQVPFLGSVPVLGHLFRSTSTSTEHRKLYVLLQATEVTRHDA
ncbi:secretin N-terminal domain-containing protein [Halomonas koreensis]|uniref:Secretin N-terminal domain-containing protein n=1 Tax=Halomonas koreensis TaxID=245385 RepID=A0ABU1FYI2_9GAMM|nr:secretin N-terminal domain-containing protein [Halomonas koreensis]MDR5865272.1 secretin N-terminal domain-containing protein [Halomonas koreensis]